MKHQLNYSKIQNNIFLKMSQPTPVSPTYIPPSLMYSDIDSRHRDPRRYRRFDMDYFGTRSLGVTFA